MFCFDGKPCSALFIACYHGAYEITEILISNAANINAVDDLGETPLHKASAKGHLDIVKLLINNGANVNAKAKDGCTPLYLSACSRHQEVSKFLLNCNASIEKDIALMLGDIDLVRHYLTQGIDANSKLTKGYAKGESWINQVVKLENKNLIELLLNYGARVNEKTGTFKLSPLHVASTGIRGKANQNICEVLIAHGADLNSKDIHNSTPLHWAAKVGNAAVVELLLGYGANVNAVNINNQTPLFESSRCHQSLVVDLLLSHNATVNITDNQGWTPLLRAFQKSGGDKIVKALVFSGADVNVSNFNGESPLHLAVAQNNIDIVRLLLAYGAQESLN